MTKPRVVVCAAIRLNKRYVICGARHWDSAMATPATSLIRNIEEVEEEQGFIDQYGVFMTREEAWEVACAAGQIKYVLNAGDYGKLFSENLY